MTARIGVIGQSGDIPPKMYDMAYKVGAEIGKRKGILLSGGRSGVMEAVSKGAKEAGGITVGILPGDSIKEGNSYLDVPLTTGLNFEYRSIVLVHSSDVIIMIGGGSGTLCELSVAYHNRKPVIILPASGGWSARIRRAAYEGKFLDDRKYTELFYTDNPVEAVEMAFKYATSP